MKIFIVITLTLLSNLSFAQNMTKVYSVEFEGYLFTDQTDLAAEINKQINHSLGPAITNKSIGHRSSLTEKFNYQILNQTHLDNGLIKVEYRFTGRLVIESGLNITKYQVTLPLNPQTIYKKANFRCASKSGEHYFYQAWSPTFRKCRLVQGEDYENFSLLSYTELGLHSQHEASDFKVNDEYKIFLYFGSDYHSTRRFGHGETSYKQSMKKYKRAGFRYIKDNNQKQEIFNKTKLQSRYKKLTGSINGIPTTVHFLLGNPDSSTPTARYEFFRYFKYAFKNASAIYYGGHAGLGTNLNFDFLENKYNERITYNQNQKQLMILSGCSTYLQSSGFFFEKKPNNLVLATNGLSVKLRVNKFLPVSFLNLFSSQKLLSNKDIFLEIYSQFKNSGAVRGYFPMTAVESN